MAQVIYPAGFGGYIEEGEERLCKYLELHLPDDYWLIPGVELPGAQRGGEVKYWEYDLLVVAPHAVYHLENKNWGGPLHGDDHFWYHHEREVQNPHKTAGFKSKLIRENLKNVQREWGRAWIDTLVTISHPRQHLSNLWGESAKKTYLVDEKLVQYLTDANRLGKPNNAISDLSEAIAHHLSGLSGRKTGADRKAVLEFEIVEILGEMEDFTDYLCKPRGLTSSIRKRVREYTLRAFGQDPELLRKREKNIQNQYNALSQISGRTFLQQVDFRLDEENGRFYEITDYLAEQTLRAVMGHRPLTQEEKLRILQNVIAALHAAHDGDVWHRDVNPNNIFLINGYAILGNFGKAFFHDHIKEGYTVYPTLEEPDLNPYQAPELLVKDASATTDLYAVGVLAYELFVGQAPVESPRELNQLGGQLPAERLPTAINPNLPIWLDEFCTRCIRSNENERFAAIEELEEFLEQATRLTVIVPATTTPPIVSSVLPGEVKVGDTISDYTVYAELGSGGFSRVFKVGHRMQGKSYAMKVFNGSVNSDAVLSEYEALCNFEHPNVVKFIWNGTLPNGQFFTLMELLEGENLQDYVTSERRLPAHRLYEMAEHILAALVAMQSLEKPLLHRDLKPQNIIWDQQNRFVLIDFNVAAGQGENNQFVGTYKYIPPDQNLPGMKVHWDTSSDTFALGITLYELACKQYPWPQGAPVVGVVVQPPHLLNPALSDAFSAFLLRAIATDSTQRFSTAADMLAALQSIGKNGLLREVSLPPFALPDHTPEGDWQAYVLSLYSQSRFGNAGTRAQPLPGRFEVETYADTQLDRRLIPAVGEGFYRLLIITGNAGDGKTAFIRRIEQSGTDLKPADTQNGANFLLNGIPFQSNYDGSQDEAGRANDAVLEAFFQPFIGQSDFSKATEGRIIAINEGRLVEFLQEHPQHRHLYQAIDTFFYREGHSELPSGLMVINLNLRSITAAINGQSSIFRQQIKLLTDKTRWQKCAGCPVEAQCFIKYNVDTFNDSSSGDEVTSRLEALLRMAILRREKHLTMREVRSFIAFMLTRDQRCVDIPKLLEQHRNEMEQYWSHAYFNITDGRAMDSGNESDLISLLRRADLVESPHPSSDRLLYFVPHEMTDFLEFSEREVPVIEAFNAIKFHVSVHQSDESVMQRVRSIHRLFARHHYFEGRSDYEKRIPYHAYREFFEFLSDPTNETQKEQIKRYIAQAIALNEGCTTPAIFERHLVLSPAEAREEFSASFRLFALEDFELIVESTPHLIEYLEYEPDRLVFRHCKEKHIALNITLDLYEMLYFIRQGFRPSLNDLRGRHIELMIFKNLLENLPYDRVLVTKDHYDFFQISKLPGNRLRLSRYEETETIVAQS